MCKFILLTYAGPHPTKLVKTNSENGMDQNESPPPNDTRKMKSEIFRLM
jgi:hypothetical protein